MTTEQLSYTQTYPRRETNTDIMDAVTLHDHDSASSHALLESLSATDWLSALQAATQISEHDCQRRAEAFNGILLRFDVHEREVKSAIMEAISENALQLAIKTIPGEKARPLLGIVDVPLDDVGVHQPPTLQQAICVANSWSVVREDVLFDAAKAMFNELASQGTGQAAVAQDIEALEQANQTGEEYRSALQAITNRDLHNIRKRTRLNS